MLNWQICDKCYQLIISHAIVHLICFIFTFDGLHVVCAQHPSEVVVQLQVCCGAGSLVHCPDDVRAVKKYETFYVKKVGGENRTLLLQSPILCS